MAIAELVIDRVKLAPQCYFCGRFVGDEAYCYGCLEYVCSDCDWTSPSGEHNVEKHQEFEDD